MIIEKVILYHIRLQLRSPFETSFGRSESRDCIILKVFSDGLASFGECVADWDPGYSYETVQTAWHILRDFIIPPLIGKESPTPKAFQVEMAKIRGHRMAKAGMEMALWDLLGKRDGQSLRQLLGGTRSQVDVGVSVGIQPSTGELVKVVENYLTQGYRRIKIKIKPGRDCVDTQAVRQACPHIRLQVDANSAYTLSSADSLKPLDALDLLLIEQPLADDDMWDHHYLQAKFSTPICLDESIHSARHARQAIEMEACRIINIKAGRVGGLSEALAIHDLCLSRQIPVWCGGMLETGVGRASNLALASLPGFSLPGDISATERYYYEDITEQSFTLNPDSTINVPTQPGLGVTINHKNLARFCITRLSLP